MKRYSHKQAAKISAKRAKEAALKKSVNRTPVKATSVNRANNNSKVVKSAKIKKLDRKIARVSARAYGGGTKKALLITAGALLFIAIVAFLGFYVFKIDFSKPQFVQKTEQVELTEKQEIVAPGVTTDFVRNQETSNMIFNTVGNLVTVENDIDYHFSDLIFRETNQDGVIVTKKVIASDYSAYSYVTRSCNDIIEINDGYLIVGYTQRGDYAYGTSNKNIWLAKINFSANIIWERTIDDGYLNSEILTIEDFGKDRKRLYIKSEALKNWFMIIDNEGEEIRKYDLSQEFLAYSDTDDGGKIFVSKRTNDISILKKISSNEEIEVEEYIIGAYRYIFDVDGGYLLFGEKEINKSLTCVAVFVDDEANLKWEKELSDLGYPKIRDVHYYEDAGYILTGHIFSTEGSDMPRSIVSLFDETNQDIQDAWVAKLDENYELSWEKTYAYGDMGSYFDGVVKDGGNKYYLLGVAQYKTPEASTIRHNSIVTGITDKAPNEEQSFADIADYDLVDTPIVNDVIASTINNKIVNGSMENDYALKVFWTAVNGAKEYKIDIYKGINDVYSGITDNHNSFVIENVVSTLGMIDLIPYTVVVTAIDEKNSSISSNDFSFTIFNNEYDVIRTWLPDFDQKNKMTNFYYRIASGANSVNVYLNKIMPDGTVNSDLVSTRFGETITHDFRTLSYGEYYYRLELSKDDGTKYIKDTPVFEYADPDPDDLSYIVLDEQRLLNELQFSSDDIKDLRLLIHLGQFDSENRDHVRILQLFCNYYLGDLSKLGIYSPDTEPQSGFDIPIEVNRYFQEDTRKAMVYLLSYFGRIGIDGEKLTRSVDSNFFKDLANLSKLPVSNDVIAAFRSDGSGAKYNAGYSFDTKHNFIEGIQLALPVDHEPQKAAYFGIRYLPILNFEEYDTGVRLHAGLDYRSEDLIVDDVAYIKDHAGEDYIDTADKVEEEVVVDKTQAEIRRDRIYSPYDGVVVKADDSSPGVGNGIHVMIKHVSKDADKTEFYTQHLHLSSVLCEVGQVLKRGEVLGTMGNTGYSGGKHLHLEIFTEEMKVGTFLNPLIYDYAYPPLKDEAMAMEREKGLIK